MAVIDGKQTIQFRSSAHSDYTKHKDLDRTARHIDRHKNNEHCGTTGVGIAGWMAKQDLV